MVCVSTWPTESWLSIDRYFKPFNSVLIVTSNQFPNLPRICTGMMLSQEFVPDAELNKVSWHANVPLSSVVTLKMVRDTLSEGIQLRLNLWSNGLLIRGCPPPVGGTKPMVSPFRFKDKVIKNKPDDRLKFQLRGRLLLLKAALWCLTHNEPSYDLISLQLVEAQTKWRFYHLKNVITYSVTLSTS